MRIKGEGHVSSVDKVETIMRCIISLGLFEENDGYVHCFKLARSISQSMTSNPALRSLISNIKQEHHDAIMTPSEQNRIEEKRKEKKRIVNPFKKWSKDDFWNELIKINEETKHEESLLTSFYSYWTEPDANGNMKLQLQKTWSTRGRLTTWSKNNFNSSSGSKQRHEQVGQVIRSKQEVKIAPFDGDF